MTRIDRYLVFLYSRVLFICFFSLSGLLIVVLFFTNLDEFIRFAEVSGRSLPQVVVEYYAPFLLTFFEQLSGMLALLALLFVVAWLNKTNEFTALLSAGVTKRRIIRPLFITSAIVILSAAAVREFAIPLYQEQLDRNPQDLTGELPRPMQPTFQEQAYSLFQGKHLLPANSQIVSPLLNIKGGPLMQSFGTKVAARNAYYRPSEDGRPAGYLFTEVFAPRNIDSQESVSGIDGLPVLLTSRDTSWLSEGECFLASDTEYELLRGGSAWKRFAATSELVTHLKGQRTRSGNDLRVQIHSRFLKPLIDWTVLLLGIPILLTRPDRHMFWIAGTCLFVVIGFTAVVLGLTALGSTGSFLSPTLATWLPILIFLPWAWARTGSAMES